MARIWAKIIIFGMGFSPSRVYEQVPEKGKSYMFIANHTSMMDIMMMLYTFKNPFVFVGKAELAKMPDFGFFYKRTCILVDRKDAGSRNTVLDRAKKRLDNGVSICMFPEGGVPEDETLVIDVFKDGAFRLAIDYQIPIVPVIFYDNKKRFSYTFYSGSLGRMRARVLPFVSTNGLQQEDRRALKGKVKNQFLTELQQKNRPL